MASALRKNITLSLEENQLIEDYCKKNGKTFSEFVRTAAVNYIKESEKQDLAEFLKRNCSYLENSEQNEIDAVMDKLKNEQDKGREVSLNELL